MNWFKIAGHDLRAGILRARYLAVPVMFCLPCFSCMMRQNGVVTGNWMDYWMYCVKGAPPLTAGVQEFELPVLWFLVMGGCLFLNLDYPLNDLTEAGQQVIIRAVSKKSWFLSKCVWNILSCVVYMLLGMLTALLFALASGGSASLVNTPEVCMNALQIYSIEALTVAQALTAAVVLPLLTLMALNMLQMVLCLMMKPVFGFLICICLLLVSLFINSPYALGNGAMMVRSGVFFEGGLNPVAAGVTCLVFIGVSVVTGIIRFNRMDHLRYEG